MQTQLIHKNFFLEYVGYNAILWERLQSQILNHNILYLVSTFAKIQVHFYSFFHELFRLQQCIRSCLITQLHNSNLQTQLISLCEHATLTLTWSTFYQENISSHKKLIGPTIDTQLESRTWCKNLIRANLRMITISWYFHRSLDLYHLDFFHLLHKYNGLRKIRARY